VVVSSSIAGAVVRVGKRLELIALSAKKEMVRDETHFPSFMRAVADGLRDHTRL